MPQALAPGPGGDGGDPTPSHGELQQKHWEQDMGEMDAVEHAAPPVVGAHFLESRHLESRPRAYTIGS
jgi:hypothetical protein